MKQDFEHSALPSGRSNAGRGAAWIELARACRLVATGPRAIDRLLELARRAVGADRAFLALEALDGSKRIQVRAVSSSRRDGRTEPSLSLLRRALSRSEQLLRLEIDSGVIASSRSVRALGLRSVAAVPVPLAPPCRAVLVVDSRDLAMAQAAVELLEAFASLIGRSVGQDARMAVRPESLLDTSFVSPVQRSMVDWVRRVATTRLPVLVRGESGSGKESVARALHGWSTRSEGPFVAVNCSAIADTLLEAELFGAVRGAYTGADRDRPGLLRMAHGGTLLLDEVGDMPPAMQAKLLRVLEEKQVRPVGGEVASSVDVRIVAATHRDLHSAVRDGAFRDDLLHRLAVVEVEVPPLRERLGDLRLLVDGLRARLLEETGRGPLRLTDAAWDVLRGHRWPGNIRELHAVLARALLRSGGAPVGPQHLGALDTHPEQRPAECRGLEASMVEDALAVAAGNVAQAAARIGWTRQKLYRRMRSLGVSRQRPERG